MGNRELVSKNEFNLPYFDLLLEIQEENGTDQEERLDFVHWGFWDKPGHFKPGLADYKQGQQALNQRIVELADIAPSMDIADVGCGFGGTVAELNRILRNVRLMGINIDPRQLAVAEQRVKPLGSNSISWLEADATDIPLPDNSFDRILAVECIFHFPSRQRFLNEAARLLRPGGKLVLSDFCGYRQVKANMNADYPRLAGKKGPLAKIIDKWFVRNYGELGPPPGSEPPYGRMIEQLPLELTDIHDITRNTLPTYKHIYHFVDRYRARTNKKLPDLVKATRFLDWTARLGLIRYVLLGFSKPLDQKTGRKG